MFPSLKLSPYDCADGWVAGNWENNRCCRWRTQKQNRSCLMVATDVYRPAAIDQLVTLGKQINAGV